MITTTDEIYEFTELATKRCQKHGYDDIAQQLDNAMHLGSSGLEILGAIRAVFVAERTRMTQIMDAGKVDEVIDYVDKAFGMQ